MTPRAAAATSTPARPVVERAASRRRRAASAAESAPAVVVVGVAEQQHAEAGHRQARRRGPQVPTPGRSPNPARPAGPPSAVSRRTGSDEAESRPDQANPSIRPVVGPVASLPPGTDRPHQPGRHQRQAGRRPRRIRAAPTSVSGTIDSTPNSEPASSPRIATAAEHPTVHAHRSLGQQRAQSPDQRARPERRRRDRRPARDAARPPRARRRPRLRRMRAGHGAGRRAGSSPARRVRVNPRSTGTISSAPMTTNGSRPRNTQRQLACWANVPETIGPRSEGSTQADDIAAKIFGRRCSG